MKAFKRNITWISAGLLLAMMAGAPAIADDTELLLVPPPASDATKPRIMFIIDTSTSMTSNEDTVVPYNAGQNYGGDCNSDAIYWSLLSGVLPDCAGGTNQYIDKDNWFCDAGQARLDGLGSYSSVLAQYRDGGKDGTGSGPKKWQFLAAGYNSEPVECEDDAGIHGDGRAGFLWPKAGSDLPDPFTNIEGEAAKFNGAPRNQAYTVYDGNWLNWDASPVIVSMDRIDIVKQVLTVIFRAVNDVYVGVERFNDSEGGTIIQGLVDIDVPANRTAALAAVASLTPEDHTTIAESAYESVLYWLGKPAEFAEIDGDNENFTDHAILVDPTKGAGEQEYIQPDLSACAKNYTVLLSDGRAGSRDDKTEGLTPTLPGYQAATGRTFCDDVVASESDGKCIDDIAEYLFKTDISPDATGLPGQQNVIMHTVGFAVDTENLSSAAERGGGTYYQADDGPELAAAFLEIVTTIADRDLSFVAPSVSVNAFNRTQNLNDLYLSVFKPRNRVHWPGNLKKYRIVDGVISDVNGAAAVDPATGFFKDTAKSYWTPGAADGSNVEMGGAARALPDPATRRNLYTDNSGSDLTAANNQLTPSNAGAFNDADFGLTGSASEPSIDEIIRWARGEDLLDEDKDGSMADVRYARCSLRDGRSAACEAGCGRLRWLGGESGCRSICRNQRRLPACHRWR
jgi:type IV pilus assembly protein PilY1